MNELRHDIELTGCAPTPLAHYLKALGILRLVSEQIDKTAQGWWKNDRFWLRSKLDREGLIQFFLNEYEPTPIVAPWNGGSGFFPKDNRVAIDAIRSGNALRYTNYRTLLARCERILAELHLEEKPDDQKAELLQQCRNFFPDRDLDWLDAAYVLTADGPKYPPLLGTGGNDGRLEFTNNYMQHLVAMVSPDDGTVSPMGQSSLNESLFAEQSNVRNSGTIGQFDPGSLGGANNGTGFEGASTVNSWDFLLMLDGAMTFAAAAVKKLESSQRGVLAYPFCVRSTGVGYGSADRSDEESARSEMWLPLWNAPATFSSVSTLMSEGRAVTGRRQARHGVDFARAIAGLGVDRGVNEFQRIAFQQRNGLAYLAVPLGRFQVKGNPDAEELLAPLDHWLDRFRSAASGKNAPARATRALRQIESAIFRLCERGDTRDVQDLLIALGEAEAAVAISQSLREGDKGSGINPVPLLTPDWVTKANDHSTEFRIAAALASVYDKSVGPMRRHFEPIAETSWNSDYPQWASDENDPALVWGGGDLVSKMNRVLQRRLIDVIKTGKQGNQTEILAPLRGLCPAGLGDVSRFLTGDVDHQRIEALLRGLILVDWKKWNSQRRRLDWNPTPTPDAAYCLLKLCHLPRSLKWGQNSEHTASIRLDPQISRLAMSGRLSEATKLASRRLRVSGVPPAVEEIYGSADVARRIAAALLIPISQESQLRNRVVRHDMTADSEEDTDANPVEA